MESTKHQITAWYFTTTGAFITGLTSLATPVTINWQDEAETIEIINAAGETVAQLPAASITRVYFSPSGTYSLRTANAIYRFTVRHEAVSNRVAAEAVNVIDIATGNVGSALADSKSDIEGLKTFLSTKAPDALIASSFSSKRYAKVLIISTIVISVVIIAGVIIALFSGLFSAA